MVKISVKSKVLSGKASKFWLISYRMTLRARRGPKEKERKKEKRKKKRKKEKKKRKKGGRRPRTIINCIDLGIAGGPGALPSRLNWGLTDAPSPAPPLGPPQPREGHRWVGWDQPTQAGGQYPTNK